MSSSAITKKELCPLLSRRGCGEGLTISHYDPASRVDHIRHRFILGEEVVPGPALVRCRALSCPAHCPALSCREAAGGEESTAAEEEEKEQGLWWVHS